MTFDYPHETIALAPGADFASPENFDRSGLFLVSQAGQIVVAGARPGTPGATAGVVAGEAIVSIDGKSAAGMSLKDVRDLFMQPAGTSYALVVAAKDKSTRALTLTLASYV